MDIRVNTSTKVLKLKLYLNLEGGGSKEVVVEDLHPDILSTILSHSKTEGVSFTVDGQEPLNMISDREGLAQTAELQEKALDQLRTEKETLQQKVKQLDSELTEAREIAEEWAAKVRAFGNSGVTKTKEKTSVEEVKPTLENVEMETAEGQVMSNEERRMSKTPNVQE